MNTYEEQIFSFLDEKAIPYRAFSHEVTDDLTEKLAHDAENGVFGATHCKNLFLANRSETRFFLLTVPYGEVFRTGPDSRAMGSGRLNFGTKEKLWDFLRVVPGMVSPLELIFDTERKVEFHLDSRLLHAESLCFHPANDAKTVVMETEVFTEKFLPLLGRTASPVQLER